MKKIDLTQAAPKRATIMSYGESRSGKTFFAGTWPRPLFLSDVSEGGWTTLQTMDPGLFWEEKIKPQVWGIEEPKDMMQAIGDAEPLIAKGVVQTIVIDSLTFYNDLFLAYLYRLQSKDGRSPDTRRIYGDLGRHLRELRIRIHALGANVIWLCLAKLPDDMNAIGGPMISGQEAKKVSAGCDHIFFHRSFQPSPNAPHEFEVRTRAWQRFVGGGRDGYQLPDPLGFWEVDPETDKEVFVRDCTYRTFAEARGWLKPTIVKPKPVGRAQAK